MYTLLHYFITIQYIHICDTQMIFKIDKCSISIESQSNYKCTEIKYNELNVHQ